MERLVAKNDRQVVMHYEVWAGDMCSNEGRSDTIETDTHEHAASLFCERYYNGGNWLWKEVLVQAREENTKTYSISVKQKYNGRFYTLGKKLVRDQ